ncbi:MAG: hypothetical protein ACLQE9_23480 [Roseiarcus sp.]
MKQLDVTTYPQILAPREYLHRAEEFYQAFRDLPAAPPPSWPRYFMSRHSIELGPPRHQEYHSHHCQTLARERSRVQSLLAAPSRFRNRSVAENDTARHEQGARTSVKSA